MTKVSITLNGETYTATGRDAHEATDTLIQMLERLKEYGKQIEDEHRSMHRRMRGIE